MSMEQELYGLTISTEEAFNGLQSGIMEKLMGKIERPMIGVYQDPEGQYQMLLFETLKDREEAYKTAHEIGFQTAAYWVQPVYVDTNNLKDARKMKRSRIKRGWANE